MKARIVALLFALWVCPAFAAQDPVFAKANTDFAAGRFAEAIKGYEQLVAEGKSSATLFYDLGNAYYRSDDFGKAILQYERALALEPHHAEAEANLRLAREQARALEMHTPPYDRFISFATVNGYIIAAAVAFWLAAFGIAAAFFARRKSIARVALILCALLILAGSAIAVYLRETGPRGAHLAIVTAKNAEARLAAADTAGSMLALPPGSEVQVLSTRGDWLYALLPNELHGWLRANTVEPVRL